MIARPLFEYLANTLWQLPLLLLATWLLIRIARPGLLAQHLLWFSALILAVLLPLRGIEWNSPPAIAPTAAIQYPTIGPGPTPLSVTPQTLTPSESSIATLTSIHVAPRVMRWTVGLYALLFAFSLVPA